MRSSAPLAVLVLLLAPAPACSSSDDGARSGGARDGGRAASTHARDAGAGRAAEPPAAAGDGGASASGPATPWSGTFRGETEVPDGGLPDGGTAWHGEGTVHLELRGEEVGGRIEAEGLPLEVHGNLAGTTLRAWLRSPAGRPRTEGVLLGDVQGDRLTGTWRTSGPGGVEVRAGTFEAHR